MMLKKTFSDFQNNITKYLDKVTTNHETLTITWGKNKGIVMMPLSEYNSLQTTAHELSSRKNKSRLDSAIEKLNKEESFKVSI